MLYVVTLTLLLAAHADEIGEESELVTVEGDAAGDSLASSTDPKVAKLVKAMKEKLSEKDAKIERLTVRSEKLTGATLARMAEALSRQKAVASLSGELKQRILDEIEHPKICVGPKGAECQAKPGLRSAAHKLHKEEGSLGEVAKAKKVNEGPNPAGEATTLLQLGANAGEFGESHPSGFVKATHGLCLDASQRSTNGGKVHMWACDPNNQNQQWNVNAAAGAVAKALAGTGKVENTASQLTSKGAFRHPPNLAVGKPAKQSTTYDTDKAADKAVDGMRSNQETSQCSHTNIGDASPWWTVELGKDHKISSVRIMTIGYSGDGVRINPFRIKIGNSYCTQTSGSRDWQLPPPETGDFTCSQPLVGSSVTIEVVGSNRILQLCEVEVYQAFDSATFDGETDCYAGSTYPDMMPCQQCSGPGPTQCTACQTGQLLVPWRANMTEGSCRTPKKEMQVHEVKNGHESTLAKFGIQKALGVTLPASTHLQQRGVQTLQMDAVCNVQKAVLCKQLNGTSNANCTVSATVSMAKASKVYLELNHELFKVAKSLGLNPNPQPEVTAKGLPMAAWIVSNVKPDTLSGLLHSSVKPAEACTTTAQLS